MFLYKILFWPYTMAQAFEKSRFWWEYLLAAFGGIAFALYFGGSVHALAPSLFNIEISRNLMIAGLSVYVALGILAYLINWVLGILAFVGERMEPDTD